MNHQDTVVYDGGKDYVAMDQEDGQWYRWPAAEGGWAKRTKCPASSADTLPELPMGWLALRLSGVA